MKYIDVVRLKAEIERLKGQLIRGACAAQIEMETNCKNEAYNEVLAFLDSLQQEQPSIPDNLDEASEKWCKENNKGIALCADGKSHYLAEGMDAFKAGAEWQKDQMLKDGNVILAEEDFDAEKEKSMEWGYNLRKEQMMKEAVEGDYDCQYATPAVFLDKYLDGIKDGDKVRIIIVKEEK